MLLFSRRKACFQKAALSSPGLPGGEKDICYSTKIDREGAGWPEVDQCGPALHLSESSGKTEEICALMAFCRAPANQPVRDVLGGQMYKLFVCLCFSAAPVVLVGKRAHKLDAQQLFSERTI